jgi:methionine synthase II (cobalamin-independent)
VPVFATLLGPYPAAGEPESVDDAVRDVIEEQTSAGLEPVSDGRGPREPDAAETAGDIADGWQRASRFTSRAVKASMIGPYTSRASTRRGQTRRRADPVAVLRDAIARLVASGCAFIEIEEPDAVRLADRAREQRRFIDLHRAMTADLSDRVHLSLVLTGGNVDAAGAATFFDLPYASYAFDLIAGPDNWRLIAEAPGDRGIVCGALDPASESSDRPEVLVWAAHYAASTGGRGLVRVGLANASSLASLTRERARRKVEALAEAARIASAESTEELAAALDPRAVDIRSAAFGKYVPPGGRPSGRRPER